MDREIPRHKVGPRWMGIEICLTKGVGRVYKRKRAARKRSDRQVGGASSLEERRRKEVVELDKIGERQNVKHPEPSADCGLTGTERVPCKSHSRLKVTQGRVGKQGVTHETRCG